MARVGLRPSLSTDISALLLARLMGQYCFARWRLSSVVCNEAGALAINRRREITRRNNGRDGHSVQEANSSSQSIG